METETYILEKNVKLGSIIFLLKIHDLAEYTTLTNRNPVIVRKLLHIATSSAVYASEMVHTKIEFLFLLQWKKCPRYVKLLQNIQKQLEIKKNTFLKFKFA